LLIIALFRALRRQGMFDAIPMQKLRGKEAPRFVGPLSCANDSTVQMILPRGGFVPNPEGVRERRRFVRRRLRPLRARALLAGIGRFMPRVRGGILLCGVGAA
jgi:hypothetical protein